MTLWIEAVLLSALVCAVAYADVAEDTRPASRPIIDASGYIDTSLADCGIQKAIDAAPADGAIVQLPEGRFVLERYLYLRSKITLRGKGAKTVLAIGKPETRRDISSELPKGATEIPVTGPLSGLKAGMIVFLWPDKEAERRGEVQYYKVQEIRGQTVVIDKPGEYQMRLSNKPQISWGLHTYLTSPAVKGERSITVANPELLKVGYAIKLTGKGDIWDHHFNVVTAIDGNTLQLARPLTVSAEDSLVQHGFAMITADGEKDIGVADLVIEGWKEQENPRWVGLDFCLGAIHTVRCDGIRLSNVEVRNWHSDGVSIQRGKDAVVDGCTVVNCRGRGFHSGTHFQDAEFVNLKSVGNAGDGYYYCYNNVNVNLRSSLIRQNRGHGVGGLGHPGDRPCIVEGNTIEDNGLAGIEVNGGQTSNSSIRRNVIRNNSRAKAGAWPGIALYASCEDAKAYTIEANTIASTLEEPTQLVGIEERDGDPVRGQVEQGGKVVTVTRCADGNTIRGNKFFGHTVADVIVVGQATVVEDNGLAKVVRKCVVPQRLRHPFATGKTSSL